MRKILVVLITVILLIGCGSKNTSYDAYPSEAVTEESAEYNGIADSSYDYVSEEAKAESPSENISDNQIDPASLSEKLVYKGRLNVETLEYKKALQEIKELVNKYEGIIEYESEYTSGSRWYIDENNTIMHCDMRLRIPTNHFEAFIASMEGSGKVISKDTEVINITKQYNDNSARIEALEIEQKRLLEMMEKAETVQDMIAVEERLSEVQYELNSHKSYKSSMDTDIKYSTINLRLDEVEKYSEYNRTYGERFIDSFKESFEGFLETMGDFVIFLIHALPYLLLIGLLVLIIKKLNIHLPKSNKRNKEEKKIINEEEKNKTV